MPSPPAASSPQGAREGNPTLPPLHPRAVFPRESPPRFQPPGSAGRKRGRGRRRAIPLTIHLYLASEVLVHFAVALLAIVLLYVTVVAFQLVRDGIRLGFVWPHLFRTLPYPLFFAVPLAFLIGVTLGLGRLGSDQEMSALRAQGVSHRQIGAPLGVLGAVFAGLTFYLTGWVLPGVHYE
ncbi:MAG: LptF/LptG family permease, partial [Thermoanaerobaculia bacterium]